MTTAVEYHLKASDLRHLNWLLDPTTQHDGRCAAEGATRQDVLDELHERAILDYAASSRSYSDLVEALDNVQTGKLATLPPVKMIRTLGVIADLADGNDWADLAQLHLNRRIVLDSLHELALRA